MTWICLRSLKKNVLGRLKIQNHFKQNQDDLTVGSSMSLADAEPRAGLSGASRGTCSATERLGSEVSSPQRWLVINRMWGRGGHKSKSS